MTGSVLGFKLLEQDTLYWTADTLYLSRDSLNNNKYIIANQNFKFINKNLQGLSDYGQFDLKTQELLLEEQPILWTNTAELKAQQAHIFLKDSSLQKIQLTDKASILMELETDSLYNQLAARELNAYFDSTGQLNFVEALGQAWTIFYPETQKELNDSTLQIQREGLNRLYSEYLEINIAGKEIVGITYFEQPEGIFFPMDQIDQKERWIKNFSWNPNLRPLKVSDLR
jgi:hypothetical protein